jgi:branched-chain amino acid transport system permease protein
VNFGLAGFFGLGAYATALATGAGSSVILGVCVAIFAGLAAGVLIAVATLRLRDDYLAIVTLGFAEMIRIVALNEQWLTGGANGYAGIISPGRDYFDSATFSFVYLIVVTFIVFAIWISLRRIDSGPFGRALRAVREDEDLAAFAGKRVLSLKLQAFGLSTAIIALSGAIYAHYLTYFSPEHIQPMITIYIFLAVTIGGLGRASGAVLGAYLLVGFLEGTRFLAALIPGIQAVQVAALREILVALLLLLFLNVRPQGLLAEKRPKAKPVNDPFA